MDEVLARTQMADVLDSVSWSRVVIVNGPRQCGKSTLLGQLHAQVGGSLLTLDDRDMLRIAKTAPGELVTSYPKPVLIDEVQRGGDPLVLAIKAEVDRHPRAAGQFVLAGSSRFTTVPMLSESLAGRARLIDLWPLSQGELQGRRETFIDALFGPTADLRRLEVEPLSRSAVFDRVVMGGFPPVHHLPSARARLRWLEDYARQLVERDLRELRNVRKTLDVARLLRLIAARTGQELNVVGLARNANLARDTVAEYVGLLSTIYVHQLLPAWSTNLTSRAKHHPKTHMVDSGLAAALLRLTVDRLRLPVEPMAGPLLESFVVGELVKQRTWADVSVHLGHFRDREQREVDVILEAADGRIAGIEVKASTHLTDGDDRALAYLRDRLGDRFVQGVVLHLGDRPTPLGDRLTALPVSALWA